MNKTWNWIANQILAYKIAILIALSAMTISLVYEASQIQLSYELAKILPKSDERLKRNMGKTGPLWSLA
jgi:predicted RND superfamily exporter protein